MLIASYNFSELNRVKELLLTDKAVTSLVSALCLSLVKPIFSKLQKLVLESKEKALFEELSELNDQRRSLKSAKVYSTTGDWSALESARLRTVENVRVKLVALNEKAERRILLASNALGFARRYSLWFIPRSFGSWITQVSYYFVCFLVPYLTFMLIHLRFGISRLPHDSFGLKLFFVLDNASYLFGWILIGSFTRYLALRFRERSIQSWWLRKFKAGAISVAITALLYDLFHLFIFIDLDRKDVLFRGGIINVWQAVYPARIVVHMIWLCLALQYMVSNKQNDVSHGSLAMKNEQTPAPN